MKLKRNIDQIDHYQQIPQKSADRFPRTLLASSLILTAIVGFASTAIAENPRDVDRLLRTGECKYCDLEGADLQNANLRDAELQHADLSGANLEGANLRDADLDHANLKKANLAGANLEKTDFSDADLRGANLRGAYMKGTKFCNAIMPDGEHRKRDFEGFFGGSCK
jgi:hypothetical protein